MISLNTWNTLFEGRYGSQELTILNSDDYFVSFLKSRDQSDILVQVYKIFAVFGDVEIFAETLPHQCVLYEKHFNIGEKNTYKFFILNTNTEYIDSNTISYHVDKKIRELNKLTGSIISIIKSYDLKLTSLKLLPAEYRNYFFSDPMLIKVLTNMPKSAQLSSITSIDKLLIGKKNNITVNTTLENLRATLVVGSNLDSRIFALKLVSEIYLLSSKKTIIFDDTGVFKSLAYPQQYEDVLQEYDPTLGAFGFPSKFFDYFNSFKIPLGIVPKSAFNYIFKFTGISETIINKVYTSKLITINDLINKVKQIEISDDINDFEKKRLITKLLIINKKYGNYFGNTKVNILFENRYKHLGVNKIIKIDKKDPFYVYFVLGLLKEISSGLSEEILIVIPECKSFLNNSFCGVDIISILKENPKINYLLSSEYATDLRNTDIADVRIDMIKNNDAVLRYPNRDPLRLLLRPTLSSSSIELKSSKDI